MNFYTRPAKDVFLDPESHHRYYMSAATLVYTDEYQTSWNSDYDAISPKDLLNDMECFGVGAPAGYGPESEELGAFFMICLGWDNGWDYVPGTYMAFVPFYTDVTGRDDYVGFMDHVQGRIGFYVTPGDIPREAFKLDITEVWKRLGDPLHRAESHMIVFPDGHASINDEQWSYPVTYFGELKDSILNFTVYHMLSPIPLRALWTATTFMFQGRTIQEGIVAVSYQMQFGEFESPKGVCTPLNIECLLLPM